MLKLILSSLQLLPLRPLSPLCQVPTLLLTPLMLSLLQMKTRCRRIEKKDSRVLSLHPLWHSPKPEAQPDSKFLEAAPYTAAVVAPVASCQLPMLSSATVKYACNEVTTKHWVDNPKVKFVLVEVALPHRHQGDL